MSRNHYYGWPLTVKQTRGALQVRVGVDVLAHAMKFAEWCVTYNEANREYVPSYKVTDATELANDVIHEMLREEEDGSSPLTRFLDKMTKAAVEQGTTGVEDTA